MPAPDPSHDQTGSMGSVPVNQHSLAKYYQNGEYSDLEIETNGSTRRVHKIIVCSESPVIKHKCETLRRDRTLELNQYDESTLARLLDFCYRRTYSDGEYVEGVAPLLTSMTINDVHDALRAPFDALSYMDDPRLRGICTQCEYFTEEGDEGDSQEEWEDGTLPDRSSSDGYCDSSDDEVSPGVPRSPHGVSLLVNFKVYIAAKELQIPALELVAQNRFAHTLRSHYAGFGDLPSLIEEVYLRTDSSDHLRALICQTVAAEYNKEDEVILKAEMREVMARNGEVATDVLDAVLRLRSEEEDMG